MLGVANNTVTVDKILMTNTVTATQGITGAVFSLNGGTVTSNVNQDQGWGITYNLTGATMNTSGGGNARFAMGGGSAVNVLACRTTSNTS